MKKILIAVFISAFLILVSLMYQLGAEDKSDVSKVNEKNNEVAFYLPWGDLGDNLVETGVIEDENYISDFVNNYNNEVAITSDNSKEALNALWAFGLSNKNNILESGPMTQYGSSGRFASTGGWTLSKGSSMNHYSEHDFVTLTKEQQDMVQKVSKNIFRPCCDNSTFFPDCNHGMAMLGLLEIFAAEGYTESELYDVAFKANNLWFGSMYDSVKSYLKEHEGLDNEDITSKLLVSKKYSSASGFQKVLEKVDSRPSSSSCSV